MAGTCYIDRYLCLVATFGYPLFAPKKAGRHFAGASIPMGVFSTPSHALAYVTVHRDQATECPYQDVVSTILLRDVENAKH
jgi:hypothetical protein